MDGSIKIFDVLEEDTNINMCTDRLKTKDLSEKCKSRGSGACRRYHFKSCCFNFAPYSLSKGLRKPLLSFYSMSPILLLIRLPVMVDTEILPAT